MTVSVLPQGITLGTNVTFESYPSKTWRYDPATGRLSGFLDGLDAMCQTVEILLSVRRFHWQIYSPNVGNELEAAGADLSTARVRIPAQVREALLQDDRITDVTDFVFSDAGESMVTAFTVQTIFGALRTEARIV